MSGDPARREDLWARWVEGDSLTPEEEVELGEALRADPAAQEQVLRDEELDGLLRSMGRAQRDREGFVREWNARRVAAGDARRFANRVRERLKDAPRPRRLVRWAAAALLLAILGGGLYLAHSGKPPAIATVEEVRGKVLLLPDREELAAGRGMETGQGLETPGPGSRVVLRFPDRTTLELGGNAVLPRLEEGEEGRRVTLGRGSVRASVSKQAAGRPMVFQTPQGEATVMGTLLRITVDPDAAKGTRLEVEEGAVRLRNRAGKSVEVRGGHFAVAAEGQDLVARPSLPEALPKAPSITLESIRSMAPGSWLSLPGTLLRKVLPPLEKYPRIQGQAGARSIVSAWSGGALDTRRSRLILWGGGFTNYHGNELYAFDLARLAWERLTDPTPDPADGLQKNADGTPNARATYNGLAYLTDADRLFASGGDVACTAPEKKEWADLTWTFDFDARVWTDRKPVGDRPPTAVGNFCSYDPATRKLWWGEVNSSAPGLYSYDYDGNRWARHTSDSFGRLTSVIDTKRGLLVLVGEGHVFAYDLRRPDPVRETWTTTGGDAFVKESWVGLDYDPLADRMVGWAGGAVYSLDPESRAWTFREAPGAPPATASPGREYTTGIYGRWRYVPLWDAFVLVTSIDEDVHAYKLAK